MIMVGRRCAVMRHALQPPHLVLERRDAAGDDRAHREERADRERRHAGQSLADRAAERGDAAEAHQDAADDVVDEVLGRREALPAERLRRERHRRRADEHAQHAGDAEGQHARLVGPVDEQLQQVGERRGEAERLGASRVGRDELLLERRRVLRDIAEVSRHVPAADDHGADDDAADDHLRASRGIRGRRAPTPRSPPRTRTETTA